MKQIPLKNKRGKIVDWALVDDEDYEWLMQYRWHARKNEWTTYAYGYMGGGRAANQVPMHRAIWIRHCPLSMDEILDHKDRHGLNNRKQNLRSATQTLNHGNKSKQCDALTSQYKGVAFAKNSGKWDARVSFAGQQTYIKQFENERDAAIAYDLYARQMYGEFALINFETISSEDEFRVRQLIAQHKQDGLTARYLGVYRNSRGRIVAYYKDDNRRSHYIGTFATEEMAAKARDEKVKSLGLKRHLNFP